MTEPRSELPHVDPAYDPRVDPPADVDGDAVDRAEAIDEPGRQERPDTTWIASDVP